MEDRKLVAPGSVPAGTAAAAGAVALPDRESIPRHPENIPDDGATSSLVLGTSLSLAVEDCGGSLDASLLVSVFSPEGTVFAARVCAAVVPWLRT
eukprot:m.1400419 g.1400419  ORF g.1400419 m.1400419 type:complete len:95 (+) comp25003_c0_seq44:4107-4391(+)